MGRNPTLHPSVSSAFREPGVVHRLHVTRGSGVRRLLRNAEGGEDYVSVCPVSSISTSSRKLSGPGSELEHVMNPCVQPSNFMSIERQCPYIPQRTILSGDSESLKTRFYTKNFFLGAPG